MTLPATLPPKQAPKPAASALPEKTADAGAAACNEAAKVVALPRPIDDYVGPYPKVGPTRVGTLLEQRVNAVMPKVCQQTQGALQELTGWTQPVGQVQVEIVDRSGIRATLRNQEGYGYVMAFLLSWVMPIAYAPGLGRVLIAAPTAKRYSESTLRFQLARALCAGAVAQKHRNFYDHVARRVISVRPQSYDIYACRAWAHALGESVGSTVEESGRKGPWWQRLGLLCLWPFAKEAVGPQRLAHKFVPILEKLAAHGPKGIVDRMYRFPPLCSVLYGKPGRRLLVVNHTPDYQRAQFRADVAALRQYNANAGAITYSVEI